jgi:glycosyltransferase involved in cell wall biosynthesis
MQIIPELGPGGAEQGCVDMAQAITLGGGTAIVVSNGGRKNHLHELARAGAAHINLPVHSKNPWVMWKNISRIKHLIREHHVDIVHVRSRAPAWSARSACKRTDAHFMTTCHAPYKTENRWKRWYNGIMASGERVIAISAFVADYLRKNYHISDDRIRLIHRSVAIEKFHPSMVTPDRMIKVANEWRIPDGATIVLLVGRLTRWKGQHVLIDAIAKTENPDLFAILAGPDQGRSDYTNELNQHIRDCGLESRVRIVQNNNDLPAAYLMSHIVVSASIEPEGFGRVAIEGQAMGRLVIATDHGGSRETVIDGVTGWLVPPGDSDALADTINRIMKLSPEDQAIIGLNAMMNVAHNFSREKMMNETLRVYNELLTEDVR